MAAGSAQRRCRAAPEGSTVTAIDPGAQFACHIQCQHAALALPAPVIAGHARAPARRPAPPSTNRRICASRPAIAPVSTSPMPGAAMPGLPRSHSAGVLARRADQRARAFEHARPRRSAGQADSVRRGDPPGRRHCDGRVATVPQQPRRLTRMRRQDPVAPSGRRRARQAGSVHRHRPPAAGRSRAPPRTCARAQSDRPRPGAERDDVRALAAAAAICAESSTPCRSVRADHSRRPRGFGRSGDGHQPGADRAARLHPPGARHRACRGRRRRSAPGRNSPLCASRGRRGSASRDVALARMRVSFGPEIRLAGGATSRSSKTSAGVAQARRPGTGRPSGQRS